MNRATRARAGLTGLFLGLGLLNAAQADITPPDNGNRNAMVVETIYRSQCHQLPDPATMNYYFNALQDGTKSISVVQAEITTTCRRRAQVDPCHAVQGMDEFCPPKAN